MNTAEALIIAVGRLEDILKNDDGQAWKEAAKALSQLQQAVARAQQTESELLTALKAMAAEFRALDLPYGSEAYNLATSAIIKAER